MEGSSKQTANAALRRPAGSQFHIVLFVYVVAPGCSPNTISLQHFFLSYTKYAIYRGAYSHYKNSLSLGRRPCVLFVSIHSLCLLSYRPSIFSPLVSAFMRRANTTEQHNIFGFISLLLNSFNSYSTEKAHRRVNTHLSYTAWACTFFFLVFTRIGLSLFLARLWQTCVVVLYIVVV